MRRGTQGQVAEPRGPARVPTWHGGDMSLIIFTRYSMVIVHISIRYFGFMLTVIITLSTRQVFIFFSLWDYVPFVFLIAGRMA